MLSIMNEIDPLIFHYVCFVCDTNMFFSNTIAARNPLTVTKLPCNATHGIVKATTKPNQRNTALLETTTRHGLDAPPSHLLLNIKEREMLQEFNELGRAHLFVFELTITVMFWLILTKRDNRRIKQLELFI